MCESTHHWMESVSVDASISFCNSDEEPLQFHDLLFQHRSE